MESLRELEVAFVDKLVDEARVVVEVALEHLAHERLGEGHVLKTVGLHGVLEELVVGQEVVDGLHVPDVGAIVLGLARDLGPGGGTRQRALNVAIDEAVAG